MSTHYGNKIVTNGLVFSLDYLNNRSYFGTSEWRDLTYWSKTGTMSNGATFSNDGVFFDGIDDYLDFPVLNLPSSGARSITTWVRPIGVDICSVFAYGYIGTPQGSNILHLNVLGAGDIYWGFNDGDFYTSTGLLSSTSYNCITCTYNGGALNTSNVKIYLNGVEQSTTPAGNNIGGFPSTINEYYTIGYDTGIRYFNGYISIINFYDRELTPSEVLQNYNALRTRFDI